MGIGSIDASPPTLLYTRANYMKVGIMETPFTYWPLENNWPDDGKPLAGEPKEPKWGVGKMGPRYYVVCAEADVKAMVIALNDCDMHGVRGSVI